MALAVVGSGDEYPLRIKQQDSQAAKNGTGLDQTVLTFDKLNYRVSTKNASVQLQPLSFKLLEKLAESPSEIQSVDALITAVWGNVAVSADTLKQRVFVLRKALAGSELNTLTIQAVRNEGYRLLIAAETNPGTATGHAFVVDKAARNEFHRRWWLSAGSLLLVILMLGSWWWSRAPVAVNNRLVLWSNVPIKQMPAAAAQVFEEWRSLLSAEHPASQFQLIFSELQQEIPLPIQARKSRAALISLFEIVQLQNSTAVRLSIIEGSTATVLRSELFDLQGADYKKTLQQQRNGITALNASGKLNLQNAQRENAQDPIWQNLKLLANQQ